METTKIKSQGLPPTYQSLLKEAEFIHSKLFGKSVPKEIALQYADFHMVQDSGHQDHYSLMSVLIQKDLDIEALEIALRKHRIDLTAKIHALIYLLEAHPHYFSLFVNEDSHFLKGLTLLVFGTIRTLFKMAKGKLLVWRYSLV